MQGAPLVKRTKSRSKSSKTGIWAAPDCEFCGRSLAGYTWITHTDERPIDGFICTATHPETGGDVAYFIYVMRDDQWVLIPREKNGIKGT